MTLEQCSRSPHAVKAVQTTELPQSEIITGPSPRSNLSDIQTDMDPAGRAGEKGEGTALPSAADLCLWVELDWTLSLSIHRHQALPKPKLKC